MQNSQLKLFHSLCQLAIQTSMQIFRIQCLLTFKVTCGDCLLFMNFQLLGSGPQSMKEKTTSWKLSLVDSNIAMLVPGHTFPLLVNAAEGFRILLSFGCLHRGSKAFPLATHGRGTCSHPNNHGCCKRIWKECSVLTQPWALWTPYGFPLGRKFAGRSNFW